MRKFGLVNEAQFDIGNEALRELHELGICETGRVLKIPTRATSGSAGYDIVCPATLTLSPGQEVRLPTFINAQMNDGEFLAIFPRSGLGFKYYCRLANTVGIIDKDYYNSDNNGHIWIKIRNEGDKDMTVTAGQGIAQAVFIPFLMVDGDSYENGEKRNGGFGSTNK